MRSSLAIITGVSILVVGVFAISQQAQEVEPSLNSSSANASFNTSTSVFEGIANAGGQGVVWFGIAAIVATALGVLVYASSGGR